MSEKYDKQVYSAKIIAKAIYRVLNDPNLDDEQKNIYLEKIGDYISMANKILFSQEVRNEGPE